MLYHRHALLRYRAIKPFAITVLLLFSTQSALADWDVKIASWNLKNIGPSKRENKFNLLEHYARAIAQWDIIFIQEEQDTRAIRQGIPDVIHAICNQANPNLTALGYVCETSPYKNNQAVGIIYNTKIVNLTGYKVVGGTTYPLISAIFTGAMDPSDPIEFYITNNHTSPGKAFAEITSIESQADFAKNIRGSSGNFALISLGDFNMDCSYYAKPAKHFLPLLGWSTLIDFGTKTNSKIGAKHDCAYDRIFLDDYTQTKYYQSHGIDTSTPGPIGSPPHPVYFSSSDMGNPFHQNVSDHFPVWVRLSHSKPKPTPSPIPIKVGFFDSLFSSIKSIGKGASTYSGTSSSSSTSSISSAFGYFLPSYWTSSLGTESNSPIKLSDVAESGPLNMTIRKINGKRFLMTESPYVPKSTGLYHFVIDIDGDGFYKKGIDITNNDQPGLYVKNPSQIEEKDLVLLGDNGVEQELYDVDTTKKIVIYANNLNSQKVVDLYIVSNQRMKDTNQNWSNEFSLSETALPMIESIVKDGRVRKQKQTVGVTVQGELLDNLWLKPSDYFTVLASQIDSNGNTLFDDSNEIALRTRDKYGVSFNVVIDVNQDGLYTPGLDKSDLHPINHLEDWFNANPSEALSEQSDPNAIKQYKQFLNDKLELHDGKELHENSNWGSYAQLDSYQFTCSRKLTKEIFEKYIKPSANIGFVLRPHISSIEAETNFDNFSDRNFNNMYIHGGHSAKNSCTKLTVGHFSGNISSSEDTCSHFVSNLWYEADENIALKLISTPFAFVIDASTRIEGCASFSVPKRSSL